MNKTVAKQNSQTVVHLILLVAAIGVAYLKIFHAGFMEWDDNEYVVNNKDISSFSIEHISAWFSRFYIGNYHPLTLLSYAIDHLMGGKDPFIYHLTNLLLHAGNTVILYFFINRLQPNKKVGFFVALLFAVHPSQTESVSWIAERKTLLCAFFYFTALFRYTLYIEKPSVKNMLWVCLAGIAAMLSKGVAVALPVSLFAVDIWLRRDMRRRRVWLEKVPLLLLAVITGIGAIYGQAAGKFLNLHPEYNALDTVVYGGYAYVQYIIHFLVPYQLSVIYPYPRQTDVLQYVYLGLSVLILALAVAAYRKKWFVLCGGIVFYTANIALLLQFVQFGEFLMADRYVYIACVGLLFPMIFYLFEWLERFSAARGAVVAGGIVAVVFLYLTFLRNDIWLSDFNFYDSIVAAFPNSTVAQYSIGGLYMRGGNYAEAEKHINLAVETDPGNYKAWYNKGVLYLREGKPAESLDALNRCLAINEYVKAYFSRALLYQGTGQPELALADIDKVLASQPENARAYYIKADCLEQQGNIDGALGNYNSAIACDGTDPLFYVRRGLAYAKTKQNGPAMNDLNTAVALAPGDGEALYFRGIIKYHTGQSPCEDLRAALARGYKKAQEALDQACRH